MRRSSAVWTPTIVESTNDVGKSTSLAFGPSGLPSISYSDATNSDLRYAAFDGAIWQFTLVHHNFAGGEVFDTTLAFSPSGRPAIVFTLSTNGGLLIAEFNGTIWVKSFVGGDYRIGAGSLNFSPTGQPAVAYYRYLGSEDLFYIVRTPFAAP